MKASAPLISAVMLVVFVTVVASYIQSWNVDYVKNKLIKNSSEDTSSLLDCSDKFFNIMKVVTVNSSYKEIFIENIGSKQSVIKQVYVYDDEGNVCYVNNSFAIAPGEVKIVYLSGCDNVSLPLYDVYISTECRPVKKHINEDMDKDKDGYNLSVDCDDYKSYILNALDGSCDGDGDGYLDYTAFRLMADKRNLDLDDNNEDVNVSESGTIMFVTNESHNGNFGGRVGLDNYCYNHRPIGLECNNIKAFVTVYYDDEVRDLQTLDVDGDGVTNVFNSSKPIYLYNATNHELRSFYTNWTLMLSTDPSYAPSEVLGNYWVWTSSKPDGSYWHEDYLGSCYNYTFGDHEWSINGRVAFGALKYNSVYCDTSSPDDFYYRWLGSTSTEESNQCDLSLYPDTLCDNRICKGTYCDYMRYLLCVCTP